MDEKLIKDAQYRKGLSIAFFNAINSVATLISALPQLKDEIKDGQGLKDTITYWRAWFLDEHKKYYAEVIANVGTNFNAPETIARIQKATSMDNLLSIWLSLSEDERRNKEIINVKNNMKKKYEKS